MSENPNISSLFDQSGNLTLLAMEHYLRDRLSKEDRALVDRHLDDSPFDREALEGLRSQLSGSLKKDLKELDQSILLAAKEKNIPAKTRRISRYYWAAAAGLTVIVTLTVVLVFMFRSAVERPKLATVPPDTLKKETAATPLPAGDTPAAFREEAAETSVATNTPPPDNAPTSYQIPEETSESGQPLAEYQPPAPEISMAIVEEEIETGQSNQVPVLGGVFEPENPGNAGVMAKSSQGRVNAAYSIQADQAMKLAEEEGPAVDTQIYLTVEKMPEYPGGDSAFSHYLEENVRYPEQAKISGIQGRVFVTFVVEIDGSVSNIKVLRGIGGGCDEEAVRAIKMMPNWIPGKQRGIPVRVQYNLPIKFLKASSP